MKELGITPDTDPVRGGTDGSRFRSWGFQRRTYLLVAKTCTVGLVRLEQTMEKATDVCKL